MSDVRSSLINMLPKDVGVGGQLIISPRGGWQSESLYIVLVAVHQYNPIHTAVFYTGFLDDEGQPAGYSKVWNPSYGREYDFNEIYYMNSYRFLGRL